MGTLSVRARYKVGNDHEIAHRMDGAHMEPGHRVHQRVPRLQALLRAGFRRPPEGDGRPGYERGFAVTLQHDRFREPLTRGRLTSYFVNSVSDPVPRAGALRLRDNAVSALPDIAPDVMPDGQQRVFVIAVARLSSVRPSPH